MENRAYALIVGLFVICLGVTGVMVTWWISGGAQDTTKYLIVSPRSVTGLNPQAAVRYRGVRVGKVIDVDLQDSREVLITIRVDSDLPITRGTRARIGTQGLTGQGYVQLDDDGTNMAPPMLAPGTRLPVIAMADGGSPLNNVVDGAQEVVSRLKQTTERMERVLSDDNIKNISLTLKNLADSSAHLQKTMTQTAALTEDLRRFSSQENAESIAATLQQLQASTRELPQAVHDFRTTLAKVDAVADRVDRLGGDVQNNLNTETLPRINDLMLGLQSSAQQLNRVLDDIERTPQVLLLGKTQQAPGPGETKPGKP